MLTATSTTSSRPATADRDVPPDVAPRPVATSVEGFRSLVLTAATLPLDDHVGWSRLRARSHEATTRLVAEGALPPHLAVDRHDPSVVVARSLAAGWRRLGENGRLDPFTW
jgi:hypothetical protein